MGGWRAKSECKICKTVVMRREGGNELRKKQLTLIPTIGVRTRAVSVEQHLHFGHINWQEMASAPVGREYWGK